MKNQDQLKLVAIELAKTLGFCHGYLGKHLVDPIDIQQFPESWHDEMDSAYLKEFDLGKELANA